MGRKPSRWLNLPKGMRARPRGKLVHYYLDTGEKPRREIPLGSDYVLAVQKWAKLTAARAPADGVPTFNYMVARYWKDVIPTKAARTQADNEKERDWLLKFFGDPPAPLDSIEPAHMKNYMRWRIQAASAAAAKRNKERVKAGRAALPIPDNIGHVRANREKALFSHMWNYARGEGLTSKPNPCAGIHGHKETGRDSAPDAELLAKVIAAADKPLQFALRLADIAGQRPADTRKMLETDIRDGVLHVDQGKTKAKLRIVIEGDLAVLLDEIAAFKRALKARKEEKREEGENVRRMHAMSLLVDEDGKALTYDTIRYRFDKARRLAGVKKAQFQFRDLRAKAATEADDAGGLRKAQALLGHTTEGMTVTYIRRKAGPKVRLTR